MEGKGEHSIHLQVWRPVRNHHDTFTLVGSNNFHIKPENIIYLMPDRDRSPVVMKGDVIGLYMDDNTLISDDFRVQYRNETGSVARYGYADRPFSFLEKDSLSVELSDKTPVITAIIGRPGYKITKITSFYRKINKTGFTLLVMFNCYGAGLNCYFYIII